MDRKAAAMRKGQAEVVHAFCPNHSSMLYALKISISMPQQ
jgi:hypothetical protein